MKKTMLTALLLITVLLCSSCDLYEKSVPSAPSTPTAEPTDAVYETLKPTEEAVSTPQNTEPAVTQEAEPVSTETPVTSTPVTTNTPTPVPTLKPTAKPTAIPTAVPTATPTVKPTEKPTAEPTQAPTEKPTDSVVTSSMLKEIENGFLRLVNEERARVGVAPLTINAHLDSCAQVRSDEIISLFSHTRPNGTECFTVVDTNKYKYSTLGENICMTSHVGSGYITPFTGSDAQIEAIYTNMYTLFRNSPDHYENMKDADFEHCGIGISYKIEKGIPMFYCAHMFGAEQ